MSANDRIITGSIQEGFVTKTGVYEWHGKNRGEKIQPYCTNQRTN
jgi:hypothetical protein